MATDKVNNAKATPIDPSFSNAPAIRGEKDFMDNDVNTPAKTGAIMAEGVSRRRVYGAFVIKNINGTTTPQKVDCDVPADYVSVFGDTQGIFMQLGSSLDDGAKIHANTNTEILIPLQGYRSVMVATDTSTSLIHVIFHDDPIHIWS